MRHIKDHMGHDSPRSAKDKKTERGELMKYFMERLNSSRVRDKLPPLTMPRMARLLMATPTPDLYYLRRICDDAKDFSKKFWWEINPKNHPASTRGESTRGGPQKNQEEKNG